MIYTVSILVSVIVLTWAFAYGIYRAVVWLEGDDD